MTQLYSFTGLKVIQNNSDHEQNQSTDINPIQKQIDKNERELPKQTAKIVDNKKITETEGKNRKVEEKILPQDQKQKSPRRKSSRIRNQPCKDYKTFIPQSKLLKKVEFQKPL